MIVHFLRARQAEVSPEEDKTNLAVVFHGLMESVGRSVGGGGMAVTRNLPGFRPGSAGLQSTASLADINSVRG
jgi:hypothetical protein